MSIAALIVSASLAGAPAGVTFVNANLATGANDGSSWANAYRGPLGLKAAIDAGAQTIWVAKGTYFPGPIGSRSTTSFVIGSPITILGGFAGGETDHSQSDPVANPTILSGDLPGGPAGQPELEAVVTVNDGTWDTHLIGLILDVCLTGTPANSLPAPRRAVVVNYGQPIFERCILRDGRAPKGGGALLNDCAASFFECTIADNIAEVAGGGVYSDRTSECYFSGCTFLNNGGGLGAGLYMGSFGDEIPGGAFPGIADSDFISNHGVFPGASGGAIAMRHALPEITHCRFLHCVVDGTGGAMHCEDSNVWIDRCQFTDCSAGGGGGGIDAINTHPTAWQTTDIWDSLFSGCHGAILARNGAETWLRSCTLVNNRAIPGQPLLYPTIATVGPQANDMVVANSIVWGNATVPGAQAGGNVQIAAGSVVEFIRSDVEGWSGPVPGLFGSSMLSVDPIFVDRDGADNFPGTEDDDLHLQPTSPCLDAGDESQINSFAWGDLDENDRVVDLPNVVNTGDGGLTFVDIGCYERQLPVCDADLDESGAVDASDLALLLGDWNVEYSAADLNHDDWVDAADLAIMLGAFGSCP